MSGFFMEDVEKKAIATAPEDYRVSLWKRYVDDILEKVKIGHYVFSLDKLYFYTDLGKHTRITMYLFKPVFNLY